MIARINQELERPTTGENRISPDEVRFYQGLRRQLQNGNAQQRQEALEILRDCFGSGEASFSAETNASMARHFAREATEARREGRTQDAEFCTRMSEAFSRGTPEQRSWARRCATGMFGTPRRAIVSCCAIGGALALAVAARQLYRHYYNSNAEQRATPPPEVRGND
jgi:hypothetical protein